MPKHDDCTPTVDDWKPGDLALCVKGGKIDTTSVPTLPKYPKAGAVYTVENIVLSHTFVDGKATALILVDGPINYIIFSDGSRKPSGRIWNVCRFRKLQPPPEEIVALLEDLRHERC